MITNNGKAVLDIPRGRNDTFDPLLIASIYARGITTRENHGWTCRGLMPPL
ncbi:MAG: hypothetical protein P8Q92_17340 [Pseudoprimorskyibacter sp.]|nr:hypothetical protein [Pseudoprimorskyibacter sp.]